MNKLKILCFITLSLTLLGSCWTGLKIFKKFTKKQEVGELYKTEQPLIQTLYNDLSCAGILDLKETYKIGSQVNGTVSDVYVKENDFVKKGQPLAKISLVKDDKDVKIARFNADKAQKELNYQKEFHERQKQLYKSGQLSKNSFQRIEADYLKSLADANATKASLEKAQLEVQNTEILAPTDGIITNVIISKGMAVLNDFQNTLFELAEDISEMKAILDIDESEVGQIKIGQKAKIIINSYPDFVIKEKISELSFVPKNGTHSGNGQAFYKASVNLNNKNRALRPGMRLNAQIRIAKAKDTTSINSMAFQIDPLLLRKIATEISYGYQALDKKVKKEAKIKNGESITRFVWIEENKKFIEKPIVVGITDEAHWQVLSGLDAKDKVVVDVQEPNKMDNIYGKWFQGSL